MAKSNMQYCNIYTYIYIYAYKYMIVSRDGNTPRRKNKINHQRGTIGPYFQTKLKTYQPRDKPRYT